MYMTSTMNPNRLLPAMTRPLAGIAMSLALGTAAASCGQAYCVLNTNWSMQGVAADPGSGRLDLRYEYINQNQLRRGKTNISAAEDTSDTTELGTVNRNFLATYDYTFSSSWGFSVALPAVSRTHNHIADPTGSATPESWDFTKVGDMRALAHYRITDAEDPLVHHGFQFGLKLPTGAYRIGNADGTLAERAMQPGSGSTDAIVGAYYSRPGLTFDSAWFAQALYQQAVAIRDEFRPGAQLSLNLGYNQPLSDALHAQIQLNALVRQHDAGANAEPDLSGGRFVFLSPGLSYALNKKTQVYGYAQLPLYRNVNGIQLSASKAFVAGVTFQF